MGYIKKSKSQKSAALEPTINRYINELSLPVDNPLFNDFQRFRQERINTGVDKSLDLFCKEVDKWPMM